MNRSRKAASCVYSVARCRVQDATFPVALLLHASLGDAHEALVVVGRRELVETPGLDEFERQLVGATFSALDRDIDDLWMKAMPTPEILATVFNAYRGTVSFDEPRSFTEKAEVGERQFKDSVVDTARRLFELEIGQGDHSIKLPVLSHSGRERDVVPPPPPVDTPSEWMARLVH
jgi:hypothetical protein